MNLTGAPMLSGPDSAFGPLRCASPMPRLDQALVERGLCESREKAKRAIMAGRVRINRQTARKPSDLVQPHDQLALEAGDKYVSRGGYKLEHALRHFQLEVDGLVALDLGASTGGFTDCLLQRGARVVYAVDVGYGQIDYRLRTDARVRLLERTNARYLTELPEPVDIAVVDVSFISLTKVLEAVSGLLRDGSAPLTTGGGDIVALIKPQFEARRKEVGRGGVVRDRETHARVIGRVARWAVTHGLRVRGLTPSPILGGEGNREFLIWLRPDPARRGLQRDET
jgi:23S rRNA (cytidine1920-2'-O)/16S rRNA (cytidine1409-2'-O)-methyltransferase